MLLRFLISFLFSFNSPPTTQISTLSLHDALPISPRRELPVGLLSRPLCRGGRRRHRSDEPRAGAVGDVRSEEHTSELQSLTNLVCRLLLEKKKKKKYTQL